MNLRTGVLTELIMSHEAIEKRTKIRKYNRSIVKLRKAQRYLKWANTKQKHVTQRAFNLLASKLSRNYASIATSVSEAQKREILLPLELNSGDICRSVEWSCSQGFEAQVCPYVRKLIQQRVKSRGHSQAKGGVGRPGINRWPGASSVGETNDAYGTRTYVLNIPSYLDTWYLISPPFLAWFKSTGRMNTTSALFDTSRWPNGKIDETLRDQVPSRSGHRLLAGSRIPRMCLRILSLWSTLLLFLK